LKPSFHDDQAKHIFKKVIESVKGTVEELHIHENAIVEEAFISHLLDTLSTMPRLKYLNLAKNGQLTSSSTVALVARMAANWQDSCS